jgi:hypothetical protein
MKRTLLLIAAGTALTFAVGPAQADLLSNGNLDLIQPTLINPTPFYLPKPQVWNYVGFRTDSGPYADGLSSEPWAGPAPTPETTDGFLNFDDPNVAYDDNYNDFGDWGVFFKPFTGNLSPDGPATAHLYQDVPGTPGETYVLTGWAGGEANFLGLAEFAVEFLDAGGVVIGGQTLDLITAGLLVDNGEAFDYKQYSVTAIAPAGTVSVRARASMLDAIGNPAGGGQAFVVDDFVLVPEPSSALLLALFGVAALARRR